MCTVYLLQPCRRHYVQVKALLIGYMFFKLLLLLKFGLNHFNSRANKHLAEKKKKYSCKQRWRAQAPWCHRRPVGVWIQCIVHKFQLNQSLHADDMRHFQFPFFQHKFIALPLRNRSWYQNSLRNFASSLACHDADQVRWQSHEEYLKSSPHALFTKSKMANFQLGAAKMMSAQNLFGSSTICILSFVHIRTIYAPRFCTV